MLFNSWWTWPSSRTFHSKESMNGIASMYDNRKLYSHIWIIAVVARGYFLFHNPAPTGDFVVSNKRHAHALLEKKDKKILAPPGGLEPPTFRLTAERASRLRHGGLILATLLLDLKTQMKLLAVSVKLVFFLIFWCVDLKWILEPWRRVIKQSHSGQKFQLWVPFILNWWPLVFLHSSEERTTCCCRLLW